MTALPSTLPAGWRGHALDGALLLFHPATGTNLRLAGPGTRGLRRVIPRTVLFALSNACNLACGFCSREVGAPSLWSPDLAFKLLSGLAERGVLEVAFGGGEPLIAPGFDDLLVRLAEQTPLVCNITTNGLRLDAARVARLRGRVGEVRVSIYEDNPWEARGRLLTDGGVRAGANLMVTPALLDGLPSILNRARAAGFQDLALLSYIGEDPRLHLDDDDVRRLSALIPETPLPLRVSACLAPRLQGVPLTSPTCGAGRDYLVISSDGRLKGCSFPTAGVPVRDADEVVANWHHHRWNFTSPAPVRGCGRPLERPQAEADGARAWVAYASNNSGDCALVGRFEAVADAEAFVSSLLPRWREGERLSWATLVNVLRAEGIEVPQRDEPPQLFVPIGASVLIDAGLALDDELTALRERVWAHRGQVVYNGVHVHEAIHLVVGVRVPEAAQPDLEVILWDRSREVVRRGRDLTALWSEDDLPELRVKVAAAGGWLAGELVQEGEGEFRLAPALARPPNRGPTWLFSRFRDAAAVPKGIAGAEGVTVAGRAVLVEGRIRPRTGRHLQRAGGLTTALQGARLRVGFWAAVARDRPLEALRGQLLGELRARCGASDEILTRPAQYSGLYAEILTADPARALLAIEAVGKTLGLNPAPCVEAEDPLVAALTRIQQDLDAQERAARGG